MRAAFLEDVGKVEVREVPEPEPAPDEVAIRVSAVGVCGSDTHYFEHGRIGRFVVEQPLILGHEAAGVITAVGREVDPARVGQRVSLEPGVPCRGCGECLSGRYNLCPDVVFFATPPVDGALAELVTLHEAFAHPVPDVLTDDEAALIEPLSVALWATMKGGVRLGSRVVVTGCGPIGLLAVQVARAAGAARVLACDPNAERRSLAVDLGADDTADAIGAEHAEGGWDVLLECSGHPGATVAALGVLARAARAVLVGMGADEIALPVQLVQERELTITGTFRYAGTWPTAIDMVARGAVDITRIVSGHFDLDHAAEALLAARRDPGAIKSVITVVAT